LNFQEKISSIEALFLTKVNKTKEKLTKKSVLKILGEKYKHFRLHLEYSRHFELSRLATNFFYNRTVLEV
jgi:hypothetical protein